MNMDAASSKASGPTKVVAVYLDGRYVQGLVFDFSALRDKCRVFPSEAAHADEAQEVDIRQLKGLFFVKEFADLEPHDTDQFTGAAHGRKLEVTFTDGQRLVGTTEGYSPKRLGFFVTPANTAGNILRVFVVNANVRQVRWL